MKKMGFMLIKLLAVIVILFIIFMILTYIILNIIDNIRENSAKIVMKNIDEAVSLYYSKKQVNNNLNSANEIFRYFNGDFINDNGDILEVEAKGIESGIITISPNGNLKYEKMIINGYNCYEGVNNFICDENERLSTSSKIKNVIFMIGDGMGQNHILAGELNKGSKLNMQTISNSTYVITTSLDYPKPTDSAAAATALATGKKTINGRLGKDANKNIIGTNIIDYVSQYNVKTGLVATQRLSHATPGGFSVYASVRSHYHTVTNRLVTESNVDVMLGGGQTDFDAITDLITTNNFTYVKDFSKVKSCTEKPSLTGCFSIDNKLIGAFAPTSITSRDDYNYSSRPSLKDMTEVALNRLDTNSDGFFVLIEGSDIDRYSETSISNGVETKRNLLYMLEELSDFDAAVGLAKEYVDNNSNTLLIVTADHETGNLDLTNIYTKEQLISTGNNVFEMGKNHTNKNVLLYAYGEGASDLTKTGIIDNTEIYDFLTQGIDNYYLN